MIKTENFVYFDTDCLSDFIMLEEVNTLLLLFGIGNIILPQAVFDEITKRYKNETERYCNNKVFIVHKIFAKTDAYNIYGALMMAPHRKKFGRGECEVISLAVSNSKKMASNNLSDVAEYVKFYELNNFTTADILVMALESGIKTQGEIVEIWAMLEKEKRSLPHCSFEEYHKRKSKSL